jgi:hypothetical protein
MSVATPFKYHRPFPFCPYNWSGVTGLSTASASLAQLTHLGWNLESLAVSFSADLVLTFNSNSANLSFAGSFSLDGAIVTGDLSDIEAEPSGMWFATASSSMRPPNQRMCPEDGLQAFSQIDAAGEANQLSCFFAPSLESSSLLLRYNFGFFVSKSTEIPPGVPTAADLFFSLGSPASAFALDSGMLNLGSLSIPWYLTADSADSLDGSTGAASVSAGFFSYL